MSEQLQRLAIDKGDFTSALETDSEDFSEGPQLSYLDRSTGEVIWVFMSDKDALEIVDIPEEENRELRERTESDSERYLKIESLSFSDNTEMITEFLRSNWTDNLALWERTFDAYTGSIRRWKKRVSANTIRAFNQFGHSYVVVLAERYLRENGIEPEWK